MKKATAAVIKKGDRYLIALRAKDDLWEFPGGRIDAGESPEECVVREIKEELNIDIDIEKVLGKIAGYYRYTDMEIDVFLGRWAAGEIALNEHLAIDWVTLEDLRTFHFVEEDKEILKIL